MSGEEFYEQSEFNMAVSYLNRLNYYFYKADDSSANLDAYGWFHSLMVLYVVISTELKQEEIKEWEEKIPVINVWVINNSGDTGIEPELYDSLHKFDMFIRKVLKRAGLLTKMKDDPRKAIFQR